jgi:phosphoglycerate dehydrogenase-like enzyme
LLLEGKLKGAAFDVFRDEPLPEDSALWGIPNLVITPHLAGMVPDYMERVIKIFVENIHRLEEGRPLVNEVDRDRAY